MTKVYCYSRCTTCKKALKWLDDNKIEYEQIDIKEDHPDEKTLRQLHKKYPITAVRFPQVSIPTFVFLQILTLSERWIMRRNVRF